MKKSFAAFMDSYFPQNGLTVDITISALLVVGCAAIGFLSRVVVMDLQANLLG